MAKVDSLPPLLIKHRGPFDMEELQIVIHGWLESRGYEVHETKFKNTASDPMHPTLIFAWESFRSVTEFVAYKMKIQFTFSDLKPIEVTTKKGQKKTLHDGSIMISINPQLEFDYNERFTRSLFHEKLQDLLVGVIYHKKIGTIWGDKLWYKAHELQNLIKEALDSMTKGYEYSDMW